MKVLKYASGFSVDFAEIVKSHALYNKVMTQEWNRV